MDHRITHARSFTTGRRSTRRVVSGTAKRPGICGHCYKVISEDIQIRCPLCRTTHHLECYANNGGCGRFECLGPNDQVVREVAQSSETLRQEVFRSALRQQMSNDRTNTQFLVAAAIVLSLVSFFVLMSVF